LLIGVLVGSTPNEISLLSPRNSRTLPNLWASWDDFHAGY